MVQREAASSNDFISVSEAFKLIAEPFGGDKKKLREFCDTVHAAYSLVNPEKYDLLYKFVRTKITGEDKSKILARQDVLDWESAKAALHENYATKRTLDFYACKIFNARQEKYESVTSWSSRMDVLSSDFRDAALTDATDSESEGIMRLVPQLGKTCFIQGLEYEKIQTIVRSRNVHHVSEATEIALEEGSSVLSIKEKRYNSQKHKDVQGKGLRCSNCNRVDHTEARCYLRKQSRDVMMLELSKIKCYNCENMGHFSKTVKQKELRMIGRTEFVIAYQDTVERTQKKLEKVVDNRPIVDQGSLGVIKMASCGMTSVCHDSTILITIEERKEQLRFY